MVFGLLVTSLRLGHCTTYDEKSLRGQIQTKTRNSVSFPRWQIPNFALTTHSIEGGLELWAAPRWP